MIVWDYRENPPLDLGDVLHWQQYVPDVSIPFHLEKNAERLRAKYLALTYDFSQYPLKGKRVVEHLDIGDGFSFWWMTSLAEKSPFKSPRIYSCLRLMALEEILTKLKPTFLTLMSDDEELGRSMKLLCISLDIEFFCEKKSNKIRADLYGLISKAIPYTAKAIAGFIKYLVQRWPLRNKNGVQLFSGDNAVFIASYFIHLNKQSCNEGKFYSNHWEQLPRVLHQLGYRINWLHHFLFSSVVPDQKTGINWVKQFNANPESEGYHYFLDSYLSVSIIFSTLKRWFLLLAKARHMRDIGTMFSTTHHHGYLWPFLKHDLQTSIYGPIGVRNCLWIEIFDAIMKDVPYQPIGLYLFENQDWESAFLKAWRKYGHGRLIGVQHATVPFWHLYYFEDRRTLTNDWVFSKLLPDQIAVNGPKALAAFTHQGYHEDKLIATEALRYLYLTQLKKEGLSGWSGKCGSPRKKVLVIGGLDPVGMNVMLQMLAEVVPKIVHDFEFTFKPHPGLQVLMTDYPDLAVVTETSETLIKILNNFDIAFTSNSTSACLEANVVGLHVIVHLCGDAFNLSPLRNSDRVSFVSEAKELYECLMGCLEVKENAQDQYSPFYLDEDLPRWRRLITSNLSEPNTHLSKINF